MVGHNIMGSILNNNREDKKEGDSVKFDRNDECTLTDENDQEGRKFKGDT